MKFRNPALLILLILFSGAVIAADDEPLIIDVRSQQEYDSGHIEGALLQPHDEIDRDINEIIPDKSRPLIVYCRSGHRAGIAKEKLESMGYRNVENAGGYRDLKARLDDCQDC